VGLWVHKSIELLRGLQQFDQAWNTFATESSCKEHQRATLQQGGQLKNSKKAILYMSWLAGGPRICFVSAIFGHVGVSLSQMSFHFPCLTERGSVFCGTH